jgi:heme/copper-type cytochrome/quinol oxidase subunit 1
MGLNGLELLIPILGIIAFFGTTIFIMSKIFKLIQMRIDAKKSTLDPTLMKELKSFREFKERTENRLMALEHIVTDDSDEEKQTYIELDSEDEPLKSEVKEEKNSNRLKNQLKS